MLIPNSKKSANTSFTEKEVTNALANWCSKQEVCEFDARKKLTKWEIENDCADRIITILKQNKFIDNSRYAESYVKDKFRFNKWGRHKIEMGLKSKGIAPNIIEKALTSIEPENAAEQLKDLLIKKLNTIKSSNPYETKSKLYRFAMSRGFDSESTLSIIDNLVKM